MSLPTLNTTKHQLTLVSNNETITFRPFTVGEEKILLTASEDSNMNNIYITLKDIIQSCTFGKVDITDLPLFDVEYIFLQLRAKSVGEIIPLKFKCEHTGETISTKIDISKLKPTGELISNEVSLTDEVKLTLKCPTLSTVQNIDADDFIAVICSCIDTIYNDSDIYTIDSQAELYQWVSDMDKGQISNILKYFNSIPKLQHDVKYTVDGKDYSLHIEGLRDFFTLG